MRRLAIVAGLLALLGATGPALAAQCPKLIKQIQDAAGVRFDSAAYEARQKAAQAQKLHDEGKHADSEKVAREALALLGLKM